MAGDIQARSLGARFWRLCAASATTNLGDGLRLAALPLLASEVTNDPGLIAGATTAAMLPWLVWSLPFGLFIDRADRRRTIVTANLLRVVVAVGLVGAITTGHASIWVVYLAAFLLGTAEVLADTAAQTLVPSIVSPQHLERANGRLYTVDVAGNNFIGPPLGAWLFAIAVVAPFGVSIPILLVGAALVASIRGDYRPEARPESQTLWSALGEGIKWMWARPLFRTLAVLACVTNFALASVSALLVVVAEESLGYGPVGYGILLVALAAGSMVGGLLVERVTQRVHLSRVVLLGVLAFAVSLPVVAISRFGALTAVALVCVGTAVMFLNVVTVTLRQSAVPESLLGRVTSVYRVVSLGSVPAGAALSGALASAFGLPTPFWAGGAVMVGVAVIVARVVTRDAVDAARHGAEATSETPAAKN